MILKHNRILKILFFASLFLGHELSQGAKHKPSEEPFLLGEIEIYHEGEGFHGMQVDEATFKKQTTAEQLKES